MKVLCAFVSLAVAIVAAPVRAETDTASPAAAVGAAPVRGETAPQPAAVVAAPVHAEATPPPRAAAPSLWRSDWRPVSWPEVSVFAGLEAASLIGPLIWTK